MPPATKPKNGLAIGRAPSQPKRKGKKQGLDDVFALGDYLCKRFNCIEKLNAFKGGKIKKEDKRALKKEEIGQFIGLYREFISHCVALNVLLEKRPPYMLGAEAEKDMAHTEEGVGRGVKMFIERTRPEEATEGGAAAADDTGKPVNADTIQESAE